MSTKRSLGIAAACGMLATATMLAVWSGSPRALVVPLVFDFLAVADVSVWLWRKHR